MFEDSDWFSSKGYWYKKDPLQIKIISNAGCFVGSNTIEGANVKVVTEALKQHPLVLQKGLQLEI
jgi:hypothetical protein